MKQSKFVYAVSIALSTSGVFVGAVIALVGIGYLVDTYLGTKPFGILVGGIGGFVTGMSLVYNLLLTTKSTNQQGKNEK